MIANVGRIKRSAAPAVVFPLRMFRSQQMDYITLEKLIRDVAASASALQHHRFAQDTIRRLLTATESAIRTEFDDRERELLQSVIDCLQKDNPEPAINALNCLERSIASDDTRAGEFSQSTLALISSLDWYNKYLTSSNSASIAQLAVVRVELIDFNSHGLVRDYSHENVMAASEMKDEWKRVTDFLS